jgi:hypothetical protein
MGTVTVRKNAMAAIGSVLAVAFFWLCASSRSTTSRLKPLLAQRRRCRAARPVRALEH